MRLPHLVPALLALAGLASPAAAVDLTKIERRIGKEPTYQTKSPRYCLLVFGPEAKTRVWLVLDGDTLYVDRNGNGDLTEEGEKVTLPAFKNESKDGPNNGDREAKVGLITAGPTRYSLMVMQARLRKGYKPRTPDEEEMFKLLGSIPDGVFTAIVVGEPSKGGDRDGPAPSSAVVFADHQGVLQFAARPQDAPIVHFNGQLMMTLHPMQKLVRGQEIELKAGVGTPGLGKGTFATIMYEKVIPNDAHPIAEIEFPPAGPGKAPMKTKVILSKRC